MDIMVIVSFVGVNVCKISGEWIIYMMKGESGNDIFFLSLYVNVYY